MLIANPDRVARFILLCLPVNDVGKYKKRFFKPLIATGNYCRMVNSPFSFFSINAQVLIIVATKPTVKCVDTIGYHGIVIGFPNAQ